MFKKTNLLLDATILANAFSTSNSDRTGVFFSVYEICMRLIQSDAFRVFIYCAPGRESDLRKALDSFHVLDKVILPSCMRTENLSRMEKLKERVRQRRRQKKRLSRIWYQLRLSAFRLSERFNRFRSWDEKYELIDVFLSPFHGIPERIKQAKHIRKFLILYDTTPISLPEIEKPNMVWFQEIQKSLDPSYTYFAISEYTKNDFLRYFPQLRADRIHVTPLAAAPHFYHCTDTRKIHDVQRKYAIPFGTKYLFSLCTLQPRKNLVFAVKGFSAFIKKYQIDDLYFVLGGGHWDAFIDVLKSEINLLDHIKYKIIRTGYIADEDLAPLYAGAFASVYPSLYEGFGLPILEAMQCGCPVICSNTTSMPEVIGDAGIQIDPRSQDDLVDAYHRMYFDKDFRRSCIRKGLERATLFSWDKCAQQITKELLNESYSSGLYHG